MPSSAPAARAVSYTHLKNDLIMFSGIVEEAAQVVALQSDKGNLHPVSYTHLDVYKRQEAYSLCSGWRVVRYLVGMDYLW